MEEGREGEGDYDKGERKVGRERKGGKHYLGREEEGKGERRGK